MDAGKKILLDLLTGSLRFVVPVYQRRYSWGETQCRQLWADIVTAGRNPDRTHFTGSIVWMQDGGIGPDGVSRCQLIDGQQRLTSVTLLLIALAEYAREHPENLRFSTDMLIDRGYIVDKYATGEGRYKLTLSGDDREVLHACATMRSPQIGRTMPIWVPGWKRTSICSVHWSPQSMMRTWCGTVCSVSKSCLSPWTKIVTNRNWYSNQ